MVSYFSAGTSLAVAAGNPQSISAPVAAFAVTTTEGAVEVVGEPYDTAPYGIALGKDQGEFSAAVQGAMQALIDDGTYAEIVEKWNVADGAIPTSEVSS